MSRRRWSISAAANGRQPGRRRRYSILLSAPLALTVACAGILGLRPTARHHPFPHRTHAAEGVECEDCHEEISEADSSSELHIPDHELCVECHDEPHDSNPCESCHGLPYARESAAMARHHLRFEHKTHVPRSRIGCVRCHSDIKHDAPVLRPGMVTCFGCHPHREQFEIRDCDGCHVNLRAEQTRPRSHVAHDGDFIREHGVRAAAASDLCASCHSESFCAACHGQTTAALPERLAFDAPLTAGFHRAGFAARHAEEARNQPGLCSTCHTSDACFSCHREAGLAAPRPEFGSVHGAGWVGLPGSGNQHGIAARRNPAECASCHSGAGEALCVGCHRVGGVGGNPHPPGWSSRLAKRDMPCRLCHTFGY